MVIYLSLLDGLNPQQRQAAETIDGPVLIFAGAGSGKTRTLTFRIAHMVKECGIPPSQILAVTFTNKAAGEMKERIANLIGKSSRELWAGTFHSICCRLLRRYGKRIGIEPNFVIYDESDQSQLVKQAVSIADVDSEAYTPSKILNAISNGKNELLDAQGYGLSRKGPFDEIVARVYGRYQEALRQNNALDFDDLLMRAVQLLETCPDVLTEIHDQFRYILVDEYQDINHAQYRLIRALSSRHKNVCVVGDDDQSIYGWRGANVGLILSFQEDHPNTKVVKLEQNYRSTQKILDSAHAVISKNTERADKRLWTENGEGNNLVLYKAVNEDDEATWISRIIARQTRDGGTHPGDYAILYRTNAMSRAFESALREHDIPYEIIGGMSFFDRGEIKDLAAYLKVIFNPNDSISLRRIINKPARKLGDTTVARVTQIAHSAGVSMYEGLPLAADDPDLRPAQKESLIRFYGIMEELRAEMDMLSVSDLLLRTLDRTGYIAALEATGKADDADRVETLGEMITDAVKYEKRADPGEATLQGFLERLALLSDLDQAQDMENTVSLMTLHSSKGLEFPYVFMPGMEEGIFPHERSQDDEFELAEERRLFYVGLTRAEQRVFMSHARARTIFGSPRRMKPSRFLKDLPAEFIEHKGNPENQLMAMFADSEVESGPDEEFGIDMTDILQRARAHQERAREDRMKQEAIKRDIEAAREKSHTYASPEGDPRAKASRTSGKGKRSGASRDGGTKKSSEETGSVLYDGAKVYHESFGEGIVVSVERGQSDPAATIAFKKSGIKKLLANHPKLKLVK